MAAPATPKVEVIAPEAVARGKYAFEDAKRARDKKPSQAQEKEAAEVHAKQLAYAKAEGFKSIEAHNAAVAESASKRLQENQLEALAEKVAAKLKPVEPAK